ncbi:hypothetical protein [Corynebacterium alimapuense]|uniref:Uncharacterized protein n=1 Tax=Corynebacterium alimapuense TaxID=1576874 RepID=A0A3M8K6F6_9CORY|nr:hypothetical protein [Corynebacterium alimapuense]RNE48746.1 hypothetical protein C5L39_05400 [Corynebacterium alimapuense]
MRLHLSARLRAARGQSTASGPVRMDTLHLRADGEVFGTAVSGGRAHAFTARVADNRMTSFRVL